MTVKERSRPAHIEAVVIGGGYAGLLTAAVLAHSGHDVLILGGGGRSGAGGEDGAGNPGGNGGNGGGRGGAGAAPEARPAQLLRVGGRDVDDLLYGATRALRAAGARSTLLALPPGAGTYGSGMETSEFLTCSPALLTDVVRGEVLARPGYERETLWWQDARAVGLLGDRGEVRGVTVRLGDGTACAVTARLVVDAGGTRSAAESWLAELGVPPAPQSVRGTAGSCATRIYAAPAPSGTSGMPGIAGMFGSPLTVAASDGRTAFVAPVEGGRWALSQYAHRSTPLPPGLAFEDAASAFAHPVIRRLVSEAEPLTDVCVSEVRRARWRRYERIRDWPRRFVVLGDALADFGRPDGRGLTSAEEAVRALRNELAQGGISHPTVSRRAQRKIAEQVARVWPGAGLPGSGGTRTARAGSRFEFAGPRTYARAVAGGFLRRGPR
ncbi:hypothetical protein [Streptomyces sp. NPDC127112]|uniref:hypothetical protein n=1 Tax=Streptomyces sp. NPDC127112 TaxID=3345364 RepID=UPI003641A260